MLHGGNGSDTLAGRTGSDTLFGEAGADVFVCVPEGGNATVSDFEDGTDLIDFSAFGFASASEARQQSTNQGDDVLFDFGADGTLLVENIAKSQLSAPDFIL